MELQLSPPEGWTPVPDPSKIAAPEQSSASPQGWAEVPDPTKAPSGPRKPSIGSVLAQPMAAISEIPGDILGAPIDLGHKINNLARRGINAAAGTDIQPLPDNPVGGSAWINALMPANPDEVVPQNQPERVARGVGEGAKGAGEFLLGGALTKLAAPESLLGRGLAQSGNAAPAAVIRAGGVGGGAGQAASEAVPEPYKPYAQIAGNAVGGGLSTIGDMVAAKAWKGVTATAQPITDRIARVVSPESATYNQSLRRVGNAIAQDAKAGGPTPQQMLERIGASPDAPLNLTDVGGENLKGLAGQMVRAPGPGRQIITDALKGRDADAGTRLISAVDSGIGSGDVSETAQRLMQERAAAAAPLYQKAGIPSDPAEYGNAPLVQNPALTRLLTKSKDIQSAITAAKQLPDYADLPDNSMVLLDKAYKNVGGMANQAKVSGNGETARDLNSLRGQLLRAITSDQTDHPYKQALDAYSGPSQSLSALEDGRSIFTKAPSEISQDLAGLSPADQQFYKIGAAGAIRTNISRTSSGGNEALRITGNNYVRQQIRPLFPDSASFKKFMNGAGDEDLMFQTKQQTIGGSDTARRLAQDGQGEGDGILGPLVGGAIALKTGEPMVALGSALRGVKGLSDFLNKATPDMNRQIARILTNPSAPGNQVLLQQIMEKANRLNSGGKLRLPAAATGAVSSVLSQPPSLPPPNSDR